MRRGAVLSAKCFKCLLSRCREIRLHPVQSVSPAALKRTRAALGRITLILFTESPNGLSSQFGSLLGSYLRAAYALSLSKMALRSCHNSTLLGASLRLP